MKEKKSISVNVRLTAAEYDNLRGKAEETRVPISDFMRKAIAGAQIQRFRNNIRECKK